MATDLTHVGIRFVVVARPEIYRSSYLCGCASLAECCVSASSIDAGSFLVKLGLWLGVRGKLHPHPRRGHSANGLLVVQVINKNDLLKVMEHGGEGGGGGWRGVRPTRFTGYRNVLRTDTE